MISRLTRNFVCLIGWMVADGGFLVLNVVVVLANYLACRVSFELLGFEMQPLATDELVGGFFGVFFSRATLAHFYALAVAVTVASGLFLVFKLAFRISRLFEDRRAYLRAGNQEGARAAVRQIIYDLIMMFVFAIPLTVAINWDIDLFRYRSVAGALGIEDPEVAPQLVKAWELQLQENGSLFAWSVARFGAWGYIAVTAIACLGLEFSLHKTGEYWERFLSVFGEMVQPAANQGEQAFFYDQEEQPVYDPNIPIAYDTDGNPVAGYDVTAADTTPEAANRETDDGRLDPITQPATIATAPVDSAGRNGSADSPLFDPVSAGQNETGQDGTSQNGPAGGVLFNPAMANRTRAERFTPMVSPAPRAEEGNLREVIGGAEGERVSLAAALADKQRYWVDPDTHEVWDADFRRALLDGGAPQVAS